VTASTFHPIVLDVAADPHLVRPLGDRGACDGAAWRAAIDAAVEGTRGWYDDIHGEPAWRRRMTHRLGDEILAEPLPGLATGVDDAIGRVTGDLRIERSAR
jgi:hypothetical protein